LLGERGGDRQGKEAKQAIHRDLLWMHFTPRGWAPGWAG
jgi:hypothetical protein